MSETGETKENVSGESSVADVGSVMENDPQDGTGDEVAAECSDLSESCKDASEDTLVVLSKNQLKKQKKRERWQQIKGEKRHAERERKKKKLAEMRERGEEFGPSRKTLKKNKMEESACKQRVVIDCSFDRYMTEKDTAFLVQQIQYSYAANRRAVSPLQLYICGIGGETKKRLDSIGDYKAWDIHKEERPFTKCFKKEEVVYLTSESPIVLQNLDDDKVYVIGGLVDHNQYKGLCYGLAEREGLSHAQLPLGQYLQMKTRKVLTINQVFEILLRFTETRDWQSSMLAVVPRRKGVTCLTDHQDRTDPGKSEDSHGAQVSEDKSEITENMDLEDGSKNAKTVDSKDESRENVNLEEESKNAKAVDAKDESRENVDLEDESKNAKTVDSKDEIRAETVVSRNESESKTVDSDESNNAEIEDLEDEGVD